MQTEGFVDGDGARLQPAGYSLCPAGVSGLDVGTESIMGQPYQMDEVGRFRAANDSGTRRACSQTQLRPDLMCRFRVGRVANWMGDMRASELPGVGASTGDGKM